MLMNFNGDDDRRARALKALRSRDESRDDVLQNFVRAHYRHLSGELRRIRKQLRSRINGTAT